MGRFETMDFMVKSPSSSEETKSASRVAEVPRFSITLLDAANSATR